MKIGGVIMLLSLGGIVAVLGFAKPVIPISDQEQQLIEAVAQDDLVMVRRLVKQGTNINALDGR